MAGKTKLKVFLFDFNFDLLGIPCFNIFMDRGIYGRVRNKHELALMKLCVHVVY